MKVFFAFVTCGLAILALAYSGANLLGSPGGQSLDLPCVSGRVDS